MASKAATWAAEFARVKNAIPERMPVICKEDGDGSPLGAGVTEDGRCVISHGAITMWLREPAALALARWILDTFGDDAKETAS